MFTFKKIASVLTSAVMLSSTIGFAAAASYPAPFVAGGTEDSAIVVGVNAAAADWIAATDVQKNLNALVTSGSGGTTNTVTGEAAPVFSSGTKLYVNDSLNTVKNSLTKGDLPTVLADGSFSGNVDTSYSQVITLGSNPRVTFEKQPTSSDEPQYALKTSSSSGNYIYNATVTFNKAVNFSHADSEGQSINLFGQKYTVSSATDATNLVLLQSAEKVSLDSDNPSADVTISGETYTIELVSSSDTAATIKVTDSTGSSETKEVNEAASKKINGVTVAVINADETNLKLSASVVAGSEKITMASGSTITYGESDASINGATATFTGGTGAMTKLYVSIIAPESDKDAIKVGESFVDPVFKTFKIDFAGLSIGSEEDNSARESISVKPSGDDKMEVLFTDHTGVEKTVMFAKNTTASFDLYADDDNRNLSVFEAETLHKGDFVVVGNEREGHLLKLDSVINETTGQSNDKATFIDMFTGDTIKTVWTSEGTGTITVGGKDFSVTLVGPQGIASEAYNVSLNYPDSSGAGVAVIYPTIETSKGAKLAFYAPQTISLNLWDGTNALTELKFPDGDGYTSVSSIARGTGADLNTWNFTAGGTAYQLVTNSTASTSSFTATIGKLSYNFTSTGTINQTRVLLRDVGGTNINGPGLVIFEEKDDNNNYEGLIVKLKSGRTSTDGIGVTDVERTWGNDDTAWESTISGANKQKDGDLFGSIITTDTSSSAGKYSSIISYPGEQINAIIYVAEIDAAITPGTTGGGSGGNVLIVKDKDVSSVASKNLFVVGGSCINTVAAKILGSDIPLCTTAFTDKTGVGPGGYLIQVVKASEAVTGGSETKIAMLVAGYEAAETNNAVDAALEGVTTDVGTKVTYPVLSS